MPEFGISNAGVWRSWNGPLAEGSVVRIMLPPIFFLLKISIQWTCWAQKRSRKCGWERRMKKILEGFNKDVWRTCGEWHVLENEFPSTVMSNITMCVILNTWVVYMLFFAESTLPGTRQRDLTLRAFWKVRMWDTAGR